MYPFSEPYDENRVVIAGGVAYIFERGGRGELSPTGGSGTISASSFLTGLSAGDVGLSCTKERGLRCCGVLGSDLVSRLISSAMLTLDGLLPESDTTTREVVSPPCEALGRYLPCWNAE